MWRRLVFSVTSKKIRWLLLRWKRVLLVMGCAGLFAAVATDHLVFSSHLSAYVAPSPKLHPKYHELIHEYVFQPVRTEHGDLVNIILVRAPFRNKRQKQLFLQYQREILFLGISSFEDYPLFSGNPFTARFDPQHYLGLFPGFLNMFRNPQDFFPAHVKTALISQSDFELPSPAATVPKIYDFIYSGSDQDVDNGCIGWSSYAKNWSFVKDSLEVFCAMNLTGVLIATKSKGGTRACEIPAACEGKVLQTKFLAQSEFFDYLARSRFIFLPQIHDASPRVCTQALSHNVPMLMNVHISGGWKYLNNQTGEFFHDLSDLTASVQRLQENLDKYTPRSFVEANYGNRNAGRRLHQFVLENFPHRVILPNHSQLLIPSGA